MKTKNLKVPILYCRVSTDKQCRNGITFRSPISINQQEDTLIKQIKKLISDQKRKK